MAHSRIECLSGKFLEKYTPGKAIWFLSADPVLPGPKISSFSREHQDQDHVTFHDANDMVSYWIKGSEGPCVLLRTETWMEIQYAMIFKQG